VFFKPPPPIRDKAHLKRVSEMPCCICCIDPGGVAHHLLRTDEKCAARKSGDDKTIPLCHDDHDALHRAGDEIEFLASHGITKPVEYALSLYQ
jgi:hypothetical protein